ncbi:hypothetical protein JOF41_000938 [Saccharothrix coeruleofusca]|uniref:hypothetical protein n=1 Tax=Saccharothrix coeruleofusca TaxID=33919 RepID=UPI001AE301AB|nr:hypothetical protein [Saccharothrix coeruleofusca]MBP2334760.1 hypothetical protein [Saccharothrix coeruleofusca]
MPVHVFSQQLDGIGATRQINHHPPIPLIARPKATIAVTKLAVKQSKGLSPAHTPTEQDD